MNQFKELQAFFEEFGYQVYENIKPNSNRDELKRSILLNRFQNPDKSMFLPFVVNNIEQLSAFYQQEFTQNKLKKTEESLSQKISMQLKELGISFSDNEINALVSGEKLTTKFTLKQPENQKQNPFNTINVKLNQLEQKTTLSIKFQQARITIPKEISQNISKKDKNMVIALIKNNQPFTFTIPNLNKTLRFEPTKNVKKETKIQSNSSSIFSEEKQFKYKI